VDEPVFAHTADFTYISLSDLNK